MTRDELIRELRMHSATWKSVVIFYLVLIGAMLGSAATIL
jgi:hypothetical protein